MKATIKIYENDGTGENGFPVKLIIYHQRKTRRKTIGYSFLEDWDKVSHLPLPTHDDFEDLYTSILDIRKKAIKSEFKNLEDFNDAFAYFEKQSQKKLINVYSWIDKRAADMEKQGRTGNARVYIETKVAFEKFSPELRFEEITPAFLENFKEFQKQKGNKNTTIRKYIAELRAVYNSAVKVGFVEDRQPFSDVFKNLPIRKRRARNYYLDEESLRKLENEQFKYNSYQRAADLALLQFYLCGADLVDIYYLKKEDISGNRVFLTRRKLGEKKYEFDVLLPEKAKLIIDKYKTEKPGNEYLFDWFKGWESYKTFRDNHNRDLKKVQKALEIVTVPKPSNLTTKVMRHTFATLGKFERIEEDLLRELMGHERNDVDTIYKDKYPEAERDAAQLAIINLE